MEVKQPLKNPLAFDKLYSLLPQIEFPAEPGFEELYKYAWKSAYEHIKCCDGAPQSPFMDEAFAPDRIWIWDTCFMLFYCKYAPDVFPGIKSLSNFYVPMLDGEKTPLKVHIPDNPPLFAWAEYENYRMIENKDHYKKIFSDKRYPQRMFELFENFHYGQKFDYMSSGDPVQWDKNPLGYHWSGGRCGMDNTPRGDFGIQVYDNDRAYSKILFVDALSQQALSAKIIYEFTREECYKLKHRKMCDLLNEYYWDEKDGLYYDIEAEPPHKRVKVKTPASFWPLLAGACSPEQAEKLAKNAVDPNIFGGEYPFPSVSRDSVHYESKGRYWRGGVWLPTAYMAIKALEQNGHRKLADELSERIVTQQYKTWRDFSPHTIWEAYSPSENLPSNGKFDPNSFVRPDFCGWSALGPICLMIENVLGIHADGVNQVVDWNIHQSDQHGIHNLIFGGTKADLIYNGVSTISVTTDRAFTLKVGSSTYVCNPGQQNITLKSS